MNSILSRFTSTGSALPADDDFGNASSSSHLQDLKHANGAPAQFDLPNLDVSTADDPRPLSLPLSVFTC